MKQQRAVFKRTCQFFKKTYEQLSQKKSMKIFIKLNLPILSCYFIPIEPAFAVALNSDNHLIQQSL